MPRKFLTDLEWVALGASPDQARPALTGIHVTETFIEATDSYKLLRAAQSAVIAQVGVHSFARVDGIPVLVDRIDTRFPDAAFLFDKWPAPDQGHHFLLREVDKAIAVCKAAATGNQQLGINERSKKAPGEGFLVTIKLDKGQVAFYNPLYLGVALAGAATNGTATLSTTGPIGELFIDLGGRVRQAIVMSIRRPERYEEREGWRLLSIDTLLDRVEAPALAEVAS